MSTFEPSASARPFVTNGTALVIPLLPVLVPMPAPVRLNHVSMVNVDAPNPGAAPKVTYWLEPLNCSAFPADASGIALAAADRDRTAGTAVDVVASQVRLAVGAPGQHDAAGAGGGGQVLRSRRWGLLRDGASLGRGIRRVGGEVHRCDHVVVGHIIGQAVIGVAEIGEQ